MLVGIGIYNSWDPITGGSSESANLDGRRHPRVCLMTALLDDPERRLSGPLRPKLPLVLHSRILTEHSIGAPFPHPQARPRPRTAAQLLSIIPIVAMDIVDSAVVRAESGLNL